MRRVLAIPALAAFAVLLYPGAASLASDHDQSGGTADQSCVGWQPVTPGFSYLSLNLLGISVDVGAGTPDRYGFDPCEARDPCQAHASPTPPPSPTLPPSPTRSPAPGTTTPPPPTKAPPPATPSPMIAPPPAAVPPTTVPSTTVAPAAVAPPTVIRVTRPRRPRTRPRPAKSPVFSARVPRAPGQQQAATYKPGRPVIPLGVLVTVVLTPCVITVAARLGKVLAGR